LYHGPFPGSSLCKDRERLGHPHRKGARGTPTSMCYP
jgi:hypothetical protein